MDHLASNLLSNLAEDVMAKNTDKGRDHDLPRDHEDEIRRALDEQGGDTETFDPRSGEDPGLLEMTEDPRERRLKRHTM